MSQNDDTISRQRYEDLTGQRFGFLTVLEHYGVHTTPSGTKRHLWLCECDCGTIKPVQAINLKNGTTKTCGCGKIERLSKLSTKHGGCRPGNTDRLYGIWKSMKRRCNSPKDSHYDTYGGRGVLVCDEWADNYQSFKDWAYANGYDDSAGYGECSLDRIDNNGNYCPENCRWVDRITQANNTSKNHHVELNGIKMTIAEFARAMNISKNHAWYYIDKFEREIMNGQQFDKASGCD